MKTISIPIELESASRRGENKGLVLRVGAQREVLSSEFAEIDRCLGGFGMLILTNNVEPTLSDKDLQEAISNMPEFDTMQKKSLSQRLRAVLYVQQEQKLGRKPTKEEEVEYYKAKMTAIINKIKETLND